MSNSPKESIRLIASYLPQFHAIPENDEWWGKGFTEWTNVGKAKPLFRGHYQPRVPSDLGYYDLRLEETRIAQAEMARKYGIEGFCYWHYWFGNGRRILEKPFQEVLESGKPDFPFCFGWANETWSGIWHGLNNRILAEQLYPGVKDYEKHFYEMLPAFQDKRYMKAENKPIFMIYRPLDFTDVKLFVEIWQRLAIESGLEGIYFIGQIIKPECRAAVLEKGFDAVNIVRLAEAASQGKSIVQRVYRRLWGGPNVVSYEKAYPYLSGETEREVNCIPTIIPNWDHSPRSGSRALVFHNSTPELFGKHVRDVFSKIEHKPADLRIAFVKSWNEWGEGNYLEPDLVHGLKYLETLRDGLREHV